MNEKVEKVFENTIKTIKISGFAEVYIGAYSGVPLNDSEKEKLFNKLRLIGYNVHTKFNSHGVTYYRIS